MSLFKKALILGSSSTAQEEAVVDEEGNLYYDAQEACLHPDASPDGGILCTDTEVMDRQRSAVIDIMKSLGRKLLSGKFDLLNISLPVKIFEPRSYLQKLCDPLVFPYMMEKAAAAKEPEERLKWVVTFFIAGYHRAFLTWSKPFNPILGETWHARLSDGTQAFMEQISHHPPISAFQIVGPGRRYYFHGHSKPTVTHKTNAITSYAVGERQVEFLDGTCIEVSFPEYNIRNIMSSSTTRADVSGKVEFVDRQNGLMANIQLGKVDGETGLLGRPDAVYGHLYRISIHPVHSRVSLQASDSWRSQSLRPRISHIKMKPSSSMNAFVLGNSNDRTESMHTGGDMHIPIATCSGNWLAYLDWDDERYWTLSEDTPDEWQTEEHVLPSDCSLRDDLKFLAQGDFALSQEAKDRMENDQRRDAKNRPVPT